MLNEFLTHMLQVIIVLDVVGLVAYFVLRARRSRDEEIASTTAPAPVMSRAAPLCGPSSPAPAGRSPSTHAPRRRWMAP